MTLLLIFIINFILIVIVNMFAGAKWHVLGQIFSNILANILAIGDKYFQGAKWHVLGQREWRNPRFESPAAHCRTPWGENIRSQASLVPLLPKVSANSFAFWASPVDHWHDSRMVSQVDSDNWLQFDARNQEFIGVPLENDVGRNDFFKNFLRSFLLTFLFLGRSTSLSALIVRATVPSMGSRSPPSVGRSTRSSTSSSSLYSTTRWTMALGWPEVASSWCQGSQGSSGTPTRVRLSWTR